jgi:hypothetical protein
VLFAYLALDLLPALALFLKDLDSVEQLLLLNLLLHLLLQQQGDSSLNRLDHRCKSIGIVFELSHQRINNNKLHNKKILSEKNIFLSFEVLGVFDADLITLLL